MQIMNITTQRNEDFVLTMRLQDSNGTPLYMNGALFYMSIKDKASGGVTVATLSNDDTTKRDGYIYIIDANTAKIKLFLSKDVIREPRFINTWRYDLIMRQYNTVFNICQGKFAILDGITEIDL